MSERFTAKQLRLMTEAGEEFRVPYDSPPDVLEARVSDAVLRANEVLPVGTVYEIRAKLPPDGKIPAYGRPSAETEAERLRRRTAEWGVAWYWSNYLSKVALDQGPCFRRPVHDAKVNELGGYLIVARLVTEALPFATEAVPT